MTGLVDVLMPQFGMGMTEGMITTWHVAVGDSVSQHQVIVEVAIEKVDVEIEAPESGRVIEILVNEGETAVVQQLLARIEPGEPVLGDSPGFPDAQGAIQR